MQFPVVPFTFAQQYISGFLLGGGAGGAFAPPWNLRPPSSAPTLHLPPLPKNPKRNPVYDLMIQVSSNTSVLYIKNIKNTVRHTQTAL